MFGPGKGLQTAKSEALLVLGRNGNGAKATCIRYAIAGSEDAGQNRGAAIRTAISKTGSDHAVPRGGNKTHAAHVTPGANWPPVDRQPMASNRSFSWTWPGEATPKVTIRGFSTRR